MKKECPCPYVAYYYDLVIRKMSCEDLFDIKFKNDFSIQLIKLNECKEICGAENVLYFDLGGGSGCVCARVCMCVVYLLIKISALTHYTSIRILKKLKLKCTLKLFKVSHCTLNKAHALF